MLLSSYSARMEPALPAPRSADPEMSLQVDTMILEYLFYNATKGLLAERRAAKQGSTLDGADRPDLPLQMVDGMSEDCSDVCTVSGIGEFTYI